MTVLEIAALGLAAVGWALVFLYQRLLRRVVRELEETEGEP